MDKKTYYLWIVVMSLVTTPYAHAYVDPGTGQLAWQLMLTVGIGVAFSVRRIFQFLKVVFARIARKHPTK